MGMKVILGLGAIGAISAQVNFGDYDSESLGRLTEKRYQQLITQMNFYNKDFDARRFWAYGCNCLILGDRPMSDAGLGPPVDDIDATCKKYKECLKCAAMTYGPQCVSEMKKYKFYAKGDDVKCRNRLDTCERSLCECDKMLAQSHSSTADGYDQKYHLFWGDWHPEESCAHTRALNTERVQVRACCNGRKNGQAFALYNVNRQECCLNGEIANVGEC